MANARKKPAPKIARRKPDALRKDEVVRLRVSAAQKETLTEAAQRDGLALSAWLLSLGMRAARRE